MDGRYSGATNRSIATSSGSKTQNRFETVYKTKRLAYQRTYDAWQSKKEERHYASQKIRKSELRGDPELPLQES